MPSIKANFKQWRHESVRALNRKIVPSLVERRFGSGALNTAALKSVAVFPKLGIAFNRIKKNANSTSVVVLHRLETGVLEHELAAKRASLHLEKMPPTFWPAVGRLRYAVVVRNPYSRVLSAFMNKFAKATYVEAFRPYEITPQGFAEFLHWIANGGMEADAHWDLQRKLMLLPLDRYDEVIRFETYPEEMRALLGRQGVDLTPEIDALIGYSSGRHRSAANEKLAAFYTPELYALVRELYRDDFERLGYPVDPPTS